VKGTLFLVTRGWRTNKLRTALSILGIALGVAVVTGIHVMDHNTVQSRLRAANPAHGRVDFELVPKDREAPLDVLAERLRAQSDIAAVGLVRSASVELTHAAASLGVVRCFGLAPLPEAAFGHYVVARGRELSPLDGDGAVLLGAELADAAGIAVDDELVLGPASGLVVTRCKDGRREPVPGGGTAPAPERVVVRGILAPRGLGDREQGRVIIGSFALAQRLAPTELALIQVNRVPGRDLDALRQSLGADFVVRDESAALLGENSDERAFRNGVKLLGGLALILGMFVVFQTLSQSLVERLRQIGLLRCLGASSGGIAGVFLLDAVALAACGTLVGLVLGVLLAFVLQKLGISTLGMFKDWELDELPLRPLLSIAALGFLFTLAGAAFPLLRARKLSALRILQARGLDARDDVLKGVDRFLFVLLVVLLPLGYLATTTLLSETERETQGVLLQLGGLLLVFGVLLLGAPRLVRAMGALWLLPLRRSLPLATHLVQSSLRGQTGRFAASICGLGIVLLALLALESLTTALHMDARAFGRRAMDGALYLRGEPTTEARALELATIPGVLGVTPLVGTVAAPFQVSGLSPQYLAGEGGPLAGRAEDLRRYAELRSLVVSKRLAKLSGLRAGDSVTLVSDAGPVPYLVLEVSDAVGFFPDDPAFAVAHPRWMTQDFCVPERGVERIAIRMAPDASSLSIRDAARQILPGIAFAKTGSSIVAYLVNDVTRDFRLFQILLALVLLLAAIGVVNATTIAALGRVREIGVLRALGSSRRQLRSAFLLEGLVVGGTASLVALALGLPLGRLLVLGMNRVTGLDAPYGVPWHAVIAVPLLGLGTGLLAALVPGARAARIEPAEAVRFE
jgi:putative ABC transport system permease protein